MNNIIPFKFEARELRVINDDSGSFEVVAKDAAEALGYTWQANVIGHVPEEWKGVRPINTPGGVQMMSTLTEAGLYFFLGRSDKPDALPMQKWVAGEVLPSIRKTGSYAVPKAGASQIRLAYDAAKAFPPLFRVARLLGCDKNAAAISANQMVTKLTDVNLMAGLGHVHLVAAKQDTQYFTPTELGKQIGTSAQGVNLLLAEAGMQMKRGDVWEVTEAGREFARILDTGKKHGSGVPIQQIKWSPSVLPLLGSEKEAA